MLPLLTSLFYFIFFSNGGFKKESRISINKLYAIYYQYIIMGRKGLYHLRNSDLVLKKMLSLLRQNISSKFRYTGKVTPFVFGGTNISISIFLKLW